ncbi:hypothetical protein GLOIN_2v1683833 [Rhizophagus irregularis DAOM 181602=DAOM 197198]|uniref:Uncharacterized protein n=1 Tax=Rhizophagus irregularis (strain DAOM 181602 / DAOM 197198 / MUCL 43194) TaxID=747089 RepID=A0A2P4PE82_RHIID|nr:hypothetical protein GLOIN_2v1683833 [Rhizophagus irregularis DAOM 181602=DAOM 197198]POG63698.1 hypothetical protein GLOIN_2v1683833 [Rhizophagus irregularis DAOM 181602=DAOM 197198]|eukprot:XP_025170564.1 hypothetical protein GLOIN_2v1683833 [Rhizophagus irregularis DAOM 181602=DAOM 197198]
MISKKKERLFDRIFFIVLFLYSIFYQIKVFFFFGFFFSLYFSLKLKRIFACISCLKCRINPFRSLGQR